MSLFLNCNCLLTKVVGIQGPALANPAAAETLFIVSVFGSGGTSLSVDGDVHLVSLDFLKRFSNQGKSTSKFVLVRKT